MFNIQTSNVNIKTIKLRKTQTYRTTDTHTFPQGRKTSLLPEPPK